MWWACILAGMPRLGSAGQSLIVFILPIVLAYVASLGLKVLASWVWSGFKSTT